MEFKLIVQKKFVINEGWNRFYTVDKILLRPNGPIRTEAQLCNYIYRRHGVGRYMVLAYAKNYQGFWNFWIGEIMENGFIRDTKRHGLSKLKDKWKQTRDFEEKERIEDEMETELMLKEEGLDKETQRRGPVGLKKSRPGMMHPYQGF